MRFRTSMLAILLVGGSTALCSAATIFSDDFEGYSSQANFEATWIPSGTTGTWTTAQSVSPDHSIGTAAGGTQRNDLTFSGSTATDTVATDAKPSSGRISSTTMRRTYLRRAIHWVEAMVSFSGVVRQMAG